MQASEDVVPVSHMREAYAKIRELERALERKTMEVEDQLISSSPMAWSDAPSCP